MRRPHLTSLVPLAFALAASTAGAGPRFVRNDGQWEARGRYALLGGAVRAWATTGGIVLDLPVGSGGRVVHVSLEGTSGAPVIRGEDVVVTKHHFFLGRDPVGWRTEIPGFARVRWSGVRPGVDLVVRGAGHGIEYELHLEPGADLDGFGLRFDGVDAVRRDAAALVLETPEGELRHSLPVAFVRGPGGHGSRSTPGCGSGTGGR